MRYEVWQSPRTHLAVQTFRAEHVKPADKTFEGRVGLSVTGAATYTFPLQTLESGNVQVPQGKGKV